METFNLKAAIEYQLKNRMLLKVVIIISIYTIVAFTDEAAQEALTDMPPRSEEVNNTRVRNFCRFGWNENYLTTKNSRITVHYWMHIIVPSS